MSLQVCVDASFMVKLVLAEADSERAEELWSGWLSAGATVCAPALMPFEATSAIRKHVQRGLITAERGAAAVEAFSAIAHDVVLAPAEDLCATAWSLAVRYDRPNLYDAYYLALAESLDCPLWSADDLLRRVMPDHAPRIVALHV
jgi:predicted nucleic acid-binding protein